MKRKENVAKLIEKLRTLVKADTELRKSQVVALNQYMDNPTQPETGIFKLATGVGKTRIMSMLTLAHLDENPESKVIVVVPGSTLVEQHPESFQGYREAQEGFLKKNKLPALNVPFQLDMGTFYGKGKKTPESQIVFTTYNSLDNLRQTINSDEVGLLLLDEAHHSVSPARSKTIHGFKNAIQYGMTATPTYDALRDTKKVLGDILCERTLRDAIKDCDLAECKNVLMVSDFELDLSNVGRDTTGDYDKDEYREALSHAICGNSINSGNVDNWKEAHRFIAREVAKRYRDYVDEHTGPWNGKKCLINCRSQEEAEIQAKELNNLLGPTVARVHTSDNCDDQTITDFKEGNLLIVCQVNKLTEGFDMPNLDMTINYPTCSTVREAQGAARCLRLPKLDSRIPGILPKKMGLVVDIAFKNPNYDNIVEGIHANHQVLFQDIDGVKSPIIQHTDKTLQTEEIDKDKLEELRKKAQENEKQDEVQENGEKDEVQENEVKDETPEPLPPLPPEPKEPPKKYERIGFKIISDMRELQRLTREADKLAAERYIPPKREGMWSSVDLNKKYGKGNTIFAGWLEDAFNDKEVFYLSSDKKHEHSLHLVEYVKANGMSCYCLHEAPEALKRFIELHPELLKAQNNQQLSQKRDGMLSAADIKLKYHIRDDRANKLLKNAFNDKEVFYLEVDKKHEHPLFLVEYVKSHGFPCHCLHEAPEAIKRFEELHPELLEALKNKQLPPKRDGMLSSKDIQMRYSVHSQFAGQQLKNSFNNNEVFYLESDKKHEYPIPLVEYVNSNGMPCYCLHEAPEALKRFEELHPELLESLKNKQLPLKRDGMLSSMGLYKKHGGNLSMWSDWIENAFKNKEMFYLESDKKHEHPLPLVEYVKPKTGHPSYCLHEAPEAWEALKKWLKKTYGKELKERTRTLRPTLKVASEKGGKVKQPVKAPNPPQIKRIAKHSVKHAPNIPNKSNSGKV